MIGLRSLGPGLSESRWLDVLRCAAGFGAILLLTLDHRIQWVVLLLPLTLIPQSHWERDGIALLPRIFITSMAVTQFLEPYPVAGSQMGIAAVPMILRAFLCIADGIAGLQAASRRRSQDSGEGLRLDEVIERYDSVIFSGLSIALSAHTQFPPAPTRLKGSAWLRLPAEQTTQFESIVQNVSTNCSTLFTMPGMGSFNMWSGVPTPNGWNMTGWMKGISSERQAEILSIMKSDLKVCAILNRRIVRVWNEDETGVVALPLARYVMIDMPKITEFGEYEIRVHPHRGSPWVGLTAQERGQ